MLIFFVFKMKDDLFKVWKDKKDSVQMVIFGLVDVADVCIPICWQFNIPMHRQQPPFSTTMVVIYMAFRNKKFPSAQEIAGLICALGGVFAISNHGNIHSLAISMVGLIIGLISVFTLAFYGVYPKKLLAN